MKSIGLTVLAMHRSGSSMLTALLRESGVYLGTPRYLQHADEHNQDGYLEHDLLRRANEAVFNWQGHHWFDTFDWEDHVLSEDRAASFERQASAVAADLDNGQYWAVKDPRLCFTLPYWQEALAPAAAILCVRHPIEVADSLRRRNRFPLEFGLVLWENYVNRALRVSENMSRTVVLDQDLLSNATTALTQAFDELRIPPPPELARLASSKVVKSGLRRARQSSLQPLSPTQAQLWESLCERQLPAPAAPGLIADTVVSRYLPMILLRHDSRRLLHRVHRLELAIQNLKMPESE